jgi:hypothetical protein
LKGKKIQLGLARKFTWRMRGIDTHKVCSRYTLGGVQKCLEVKGCAPGGGKRK